MSSVSGAQSRAHRRARCRAGRTATCGCRWPGSRSRGRAGRRRRPRSRARRRRRAGSGPSSPRSRLRSAIAAPISAIGSRTPVLECTQVTATTRVRGPIALTSRLVSSSTVAAAGSSYRSTRGRWRRCAARASRSDVLGRVEVVGGGQHLVARLQVEAAVHHRDAHRGAVGERELVGASRRRTTPPRAGPPPRAVALVQRQRRCRGRAGPGGGRSRPRPGRCAARARTPRTGRASGRAGTAPAPTPSPRGRSRGRRGPGAGSRSVAPDVGAAGAGVRPRGCVARRCSRRAGRHRRPVPAPRTAASCGGRHSHIVGHAGATWRRTTWTWWWWDSARAGSTPRRSSPRRGSTWSGSTATWSAASARSTAACRRR